MEWLLLPIDASRIHDVGFGVSWHGRLMVFAWSFLIPIGIISARFFKITPRQNWPVQTDNQLWWISHLLLQYSGGALMVIALYMIWPESGHNDANVVFLHHLLGWTTVTLCGLQYVAGWLRGTKGGPTEVARTGTLRGDHFDMTLRRRIFEHLHKTTGYICLLAALCAVGTGLWVSNAPHWMWLVLAAWWVCVIAFFALMQIRSGAVETYESIWGPDKDLPGNNLKPIGWGIRRRGGLGN